MKKLMFVAAALAAGICVADVTSANVVGYQGVSAQADKKVYIGGTFQRIDGKPITLGDIGVNADFGPVSDTITRLNAFGGEAAVYVYITQELCDAYNDGTGFTFVPGWYDYYEFSDWSGEETLPNYNNVELYDGESLMVQSASDDADLVYAGQVADKAVELKCAADQKRFLSNACPVGLKLGDITVNADFGPVSDTVTFLNEFGGEDSCFVYINQELCDAYNDGTGFTFVPGWYDYYEFSDWSGEETLPNYNSKPVAAGQGFMVQSASDDAAIVIPSAL